MLSPSVVCGVRILTNSAMVQALTTHSASCIRSPDTLVIRNPGSLAILLVGELPPDGATEYCQFLLKRWAANLRECRDQMLQHCP